MQVLITGAGGFVGSHLCELLRDAGHAITGLLGPEDAYAPTGVRLLCSWIDDAAILQEAMQGCDALIHLAGPSSAAASFLDPAHYARVHVAGTAAVMHQANVAGVGRRVYVSSAEIYGAVDALVGEATPANPVSPYGAAKLGAEIMARTLCRKTDAGLTIVRPFSLFGPRMREMALLNVIRGHIRNGSPMRLATLAPVRDHLSIDALGSLIGKILSHPSPPPIINACSGEGYSVGEIAKIALALAGRSDAPLAGSADRPADVTRLVGSTALAQEKLGWSPPQRFRDAFQEFLFA